MKILYVKNNSERCPEFQLKTVIYKEGNQKYIKKEALTEEAIPHLKKMKDTYSKLNASIINPNVKLAKIIDESRNSLTFEFIEGVSLEKKFNNALLSTQASQEKVLDEYISLLHTSFKTTSFKNSTTNDSLHNSLFGNLDLSVLKNETCFEDISNIDLIFSNIIYAKDAIYLIDYEWTYETALPVNYVIHRTISMLPTVLETQKYQLDNALLFHKMERHFVDHYVMNNGFYFQKHQYVKTNAYIADHIEGKEAHIRELKQFINGKEAHIDVLSTHIEDIIKLKDSQTTFLFHFAHSLRFKSRLKKFIPEKVLTFFGFTKAPPIDINDYPQDIPNKENIIHYDYQLPVRTDTIHQTMTNFTTKPLISIVMPVYNVDTKWLDLAIKSIENQWYDNWELCIADDKSPNQDTITYLKNLKNPKIKVTFLEENLNISGATNAALHSATGEYIALMDNDDEITPDALYEVVKTINTHNADFIYSDEDFISTEGICSNPHYKPDFSPDLLLSHNYITHLCCFKKELLDNVGLFDSEFDGSQDYDLFLRLTEQASNIHHIQKVLYHWRMLETSTSCNSEAKPEAIERGRQVLEKTLERRAIDASVEHGAIHHYFRVRYTIKNNPLVSIIIPFKDKPELLEMCVGSILRKSTYENYEIIGISNNSQDPKTFNMMTSLEGQDKRVSFYEYNVEFNYSDINNYAVNTYAKGEHILLLNNDIEIISPEWIESMLEHSQRDEIGCVGAKLYYPNETVQHAGIIIGLGGYAGHSHKMYPRDNAGYFNRLNIVQNLSAVTAACLMVKKSIYNEVNGLDEINFKVAYNDVDFCLRVAEKEYLNLFTPYTEAYHHESISRGYEETPEKIARFQTEKDALFARHSKILTQGDPYYNPGLTLSREDFSLCLNP